MDFQGQVEALLRQPLPQEQGPYFEQATQGLGLEVRLDSGDGKGKGIFATKPFHEGDLLWTERPLAGMQHSANRPEAWVCGHCFRFLGTVEQQLGRALLAAKVTEADGSSDAASEDSGSSGGGSGSNAATAVEPPSEEQLAALAAGHMRLPQTEAFGQPLPLPCPGGCGEEWYCCSDCAEAAWRQYHCLLCTGPSGGEGPSGEVAATAAGSKGKQPAAPATAPAAAVLPLLAADSEWGPARRTKRAHHALREFCALADETNDIFRLAAQVLAATLLSAVAKLQQHPSQQPGSSGSSGSSSAAAGAAAVLASSSPEARWAAVLAAWRPFAVGHKAAWWEAAGAVAGPEAAADMQALAADALELLTVALPRGLVAAFPALLQLPVWGSIVGMFELNNSALFVGSPVLRWVRHLEEDLPDPERTSALRLAGPFIDALGDEVAGCEGTAFYRLHSCCNHSCAPCGHAFKRDEDVDGSAVILALRDIQAGEEVTISYIDEDAPLEGRLEQLADYGFVCSCDKCAAEALAAELQLG